MAPAAGPAYLSGMARFKLYKVDAYRQDGAAAEAVLIEGGVNIKAASDEMAVTEASLVRARLKPTFIVVREGSRIVHKSEPVFSDA